MKEQILQNTGKVYLVGAGPGDPDLLTIKGQKALQQADVVVYDRLANTELLSWSGRNSEHIYVGKTPGMPSASQEQINRILISQAREHRTVVRLKGGDPFVFGRGGEEALALSEAQIDYEVVPGITSALAAPSGAGIPVTHRGMARSFTVITGHVKGDKSADYDWEQLAGLDTLVILMGMRNLASITGHLIAHGRDPSTPIAVIERATCTDQKKVVGTLQDIADKTEDINPPATIVIGEVVGLNHQTEQTEHELPVEFPELSSVLAM